MDETETRLASLERRSEELCLEILELRGRLIRYPELKEKFVSYYFLWLAIRLTLAWLLGGEVISRMLSEERWVLSFFAILGLLVGTVWSIILMKRELDE